MRRSAQGCSGRFIDTGLVPIAYAGTALSRNLRGEVFLAYSLTKADKHSHYRISCDEEGIFLYVAAPLARGQ